MIWPTVVPCELIGKDFCRGMLNDIHDRHCLLGWCDVVFPFIQARSEAKAVIKQEISKLYPKLRSSSIILFNDNDSHSLKEISSIWNRSMRRLGYTEPAGTYP